MSNFRLRKQTHYRIETGKSGVIHNGIMSDELAIEFLKVDPKRIFLFSEYPENYEKLVSGEESLCEECDRIEELKALKMKDLKELYPDVPAPVGTKKADLINAIIQSEKE